MTITAASNKVPGVKFFHVLSDQSNNEYVVAHVRREGMNRWSCSCPDFIYRRQTRAAYRYCKHIKAVVGELAASRQLKQLN
jgi:predicted nucleic acid-binding Zn finger protein